MGILLSSVTRHNFETQDITSIEQLAIYATFEHERKIREHFIGILPLSQMGGTTLSVENIWKFW